MENKCYNYSWDNVSPNIVMANELSCIRNCYLVNVSFLDGRDSAEWPVWFALFSGIYLDFECLNSVK